MLRSLYSGVSGMKVNQLKMDVIGNNIANVGTTAFKSGRTRFQDMLSQSKKSAMAPMTSTGGSNASQVGLGVQLAGIDTIVTQGTMQSTGSNLDVGIDGDGYFMVGKGPEEYSTAASAITVNSSGSGATHTVTSNTSGMDISYTRDGSFTLDNAGNLLTSDGYRVLGYSLQGLQKQTSAGAVTTGGLTFTFGTGTQLNGYSIDTVLGGTAGAPTAAVTGKVITITAASGETAANVQAAIDALKAAGTLASTSIAVTGSVTGAATGTTIAGGGGNATNPKTVTLGKLNFNFGVGTDLNGYKIQVGTVASGTATTASVNPTTKIITINCDTTAATTATAAGIQTALATALSSAGVTSEMAVSGTVDTSFTGTTAAAAGGLDESTLVHSLEGTATTPIITAVDGSQAYKADDTVLKTLKIPDSVVTSDGSTMRVKSYSITKEGVISAVLEDGSIAALGQIAMASFKNPAGLEKSGGNLYSQSSNSGDPVIRTGVGAATTDDNSQGYGDQEEGMLEMSNVDLTDQFTDMIVTNRAFQASSKMITTGDEMLQDIINLKR